MTDGTPATRPACELLEERTDASRRRAIVVLLYLALIIAESLWSALVPLIPSFAQRFALSKVEAGALLASSSVAVLLVSIPAGLLCDRLGARRVTLAAVVAMAGSSLVQGFAPDFPTLLGGRLLFGLGFGLLWACGVAWIGEAAGGNQLRALSLAVTTSGLGSVIGPAVAGVLVQDLGLVAPFVLSAAASVVVLVALARQAVSTGKPRATVTRLSDMARTAGTDPFVRASLVLMGIGGVVGSAISLLVPLQLSTNRMPTDLIGACFALAAVVFIGCSALSARAGRRAVDARLAALAIILTAGLLVLPIASHSDTACVLLLLARAPLGGFTVTITFPLAVKSARGTAVSTAAVLAMLNIIWALSVLVGPLAAGSIAQGLGDSVAYLSLIGLCLLSAWALAKAGTLARRLAAQGR